RGNRSGHVPRGVGVPGAKTSDTVIQPSPVPWMRKCRPTLRSSQQQRAGPPTKPHVRVTRTTGAAIRWQPTAPRAGETRGATAGVPPNSVLEPDGQKWKRCEVKGG